jgi:hypothetical protein
MYLFDDARVFSQKASMCLTIIPSVALLMLQRASR